MRTHDSYPQSVPEYREWLANRFDLAPDDPAVTGNGPLAAELWPKYKHKFEGWRDE